MENASGIVNAILGGWQTSGLLVFTLSSVVDATEFEALRGHMLPQKIRSGRE
jgi:hypothetical protein